MFSTIKILDKAPLFKLKGYQNNKEVEINLSEMLGKWVILGFYTSDFSELAESDLKILNQNYEKLSKQNVEIIACSVDSPIIHKEFIKKIDNLDFSLVSDLHHTTCMDYNVYDEENARAFSAYFIVDPEGKIRWYTVYDYSIGEYAKHTLETLDKLIATK